MFAGSVRPQSMQKPTLVHMIGPPPASTTFRPQTVQSSPTPLPPKSDTALQATTTTECPPNSTDSDVTRNTNSNNLLRRLASSHYQSYTTALTVTIAVGCFLLLLNILIFAGIYHQRDRGKGVIVLFFFYRLFYNTILLERKKRSQTASRHATDWYTLGFVRTMVVTLFLFLYSILRVFCVVLPSCLFKSRSVYPYII